MTVAPNLVLRWWRWSFILARRALWLNLILFGLIMLGSSAALMIGRLPIGPYEIWQVITGNAPTRAIEHVLIDIRLPRLLVTLGAGAALGASGAVFQSISRNPLGSPDVIGFTAGAATGALIWIIGFGGSGANVVIAALTGALLTGVGVYMLARKHGRVSAYRLVLTGIGVGAVLHAINALLLVKGDIDVAISANLWLAGSVDGRDWGHVWPLWLGLIVLIGPLLIGMRPLGLIEMGDDLAGPLGVPVERVRRWMLLGALTLAALATSATGPIAFVALAAPQLARRLGRSSTQPLVGATLFGAGLMLCADLLTRLAPFDLTMPIGQVTGIIGGGYLIWLLTGNRLRKTPP
ncbi:Fe(3+)-siderophore ABC transporter permease [Loktanella sp. D2R18]|uniref:FecCD family ABC transporter permease n=1 Tax=Rhodobacterales TaxID=204455 RepID=UPI000DEBC9C2|nr:MULTISPECIES: iron chelate uptake ABC transporter family permease subunit [Rhodobacterales]MDO6592018.1 iron chelate uptake ABC transporter family permease subunit [Yoonia sp. 1_MG-2023]RBW44978.1 Fe(3+)-siderophore ABC transporter permease [Loktanella sp. D2R18]